MPTLERILNDLIEIYPRLLGRISSIFVQARGRSAGKPSDRIIMVDDPGVRQFFAEGFKKQDWSTVDDTPNLYDQPDILRPWTDFERRRTAQRDL